MLQVDYNSEQEVQVTLFTDAGAAVVGAAHGDVTVKYKKYGDSTWTTKTMNASNWREDSGGVYYITFSASDLNTYGLFTLWVAHASAYDAGILLVSDYSTEAELLQDVYNIMALKVNKADITERERDVDLQLEYLQKQYTEMITQIRQLNLQIIGLRRRIAGL